MRIAFYCILLLLIALPAQAEIALLDDFNRADENLDVSASWADNVGVELVITSNQVTAASVSTGVCFYEGTFSNCEMKLTIATKPSNNQVVGVMVRVDESYNWYQLAAKTIDGDDTILLEKVTGGSPTTLATYTEEFSNGDTIKLRAVGPTLTAYKNDVLLGSETDSSYATGKPGIFVTDTTARVDDFRGREITARQAL